MSKGNAIPYYMVEVVETAENHVVESRIHDIGSDLTAANALVEALYEGYFEGVGDSVYWGDPYRDLSWCSAETGEGQAEVRFTGRPDHRVWLEVKKLQGRGADGEKPALEVEIPQGRLIAEAGADPDYPGIAVSVQLPGGIPQQVAIVESDPSDGVPQLKLHLWGDPLIEEPTHSEALVPGKAVNGANPCVADEGEAKEWKDAFPAPEQ